ncbi:MAG TPA: ATP-binding protein [Lentimicrobium sp.]|nr:ATP-binding protein [Lentimicrobium sp.]
MKKQNKTETSETYYASADHSSVDDILATYSQLSEEVQLRMISDAMPDIALILSPNREIVFSNKALVSLLGLSEEKSVLGLRPGELLNCIHASETGNGCGTSVSCRYCGAVNAILECQKTGQSVKSECRITSLVNGQNQSYDLQVNASPYMFNAKKYIIFTIKDISDSKRRRALERMFFHDVLNTATGLNGLIGALKESQDPDEMREVLEFAEKASHDLIEDLISQRALSAAENGDLELKISRFSSLQILHDVAAYLSHHETATGKRIYVEPLSHGIQMESDSQLLKRVLINLVKNALEASPVGAMVSLSSRVTDRTISFCVKNSTFMPVHIQAQIFQRSFSTKGADRGIGTYSVKLLTNRYLKGNVTFETNEVDGTTFKIELPLGIK